MLSAYLAMVGTDEEKDIVTRLYNTYKAYLYTISMSILHNRADAEDAVHETFVRIIKNLSKIEDVDSQKTKSFIAIIVRNICFDMLRKSTHEALYEECNLGEYTTNDIIKETEAKLDCETVMNNINELSPTLKNIATLYFVMQYSGPQILDLNEAAVYSAISRARRILIKKHGGNTNE